MSAQKSDNSNHTTNPAVHHGPLAGLDPFAPPGVYYGKSHGPRKVAKSRTYSAVSLSVKQYFACRKFWLRGKHYLI